ncbi:MAG: FAD-dependent thymidylate synthase [Candidatus Margulisiibacteriota bacterium]
MKILLAGYNLDTEVIEGLKRGETNRTDVTPEVLSASYARISRDPRPIDELRAVARKEVEKARKSNQSIIFKMGHHSVAEHAVFNFDMIGVTRLAFEEIEKFRLCSYTEKSQRYQKLEGNYLVPEKIDSSGFKQLFIETVEAQNSAYAEMVNKNVPPEDARYITSFATLGQVGMTLNARNLELLFRRFASNPLKEVQAIGKAMYELIKPIAPSIILFTEPNPLDRDTYSELSKQAQKLKPAKGKEKINEVRLIDHTKGADDKLIAALLCTSSNLPYQSCLKTAKSLSGPKKEAVIKTSLKNMEFYDSTLREFEFPDLTFEIVLSAACFGQLKRHRMATLACQDYDPSLGITIPPTIIEAGLEKQFKKIASQTEAAYSKLKKAVPHAANYILTNAHRKRVLFKCNARELYHISRLREDAHAQWDIMNISKAMAAAAKKVMPGTMMTICGKDVYPEVYEKVFGGKPKIIPA